MLSTRTSGILLHPTSLPGKYGSGDFGSGASQFIDWLASAGQTCWQVLPLGEIGPGNSPYMSDSAYAGNVLLIDLEKLADRGWLEMHELVPHAGFEADRVRYDYVKSYRMQRLRLAAERFFTHPSDEGHAAYSEFCQREKTWLDAYAMFKAIGRQQHAWESWPADLRACNVAALDKAAKKLADEIGFWKFCQWCFAWQWDELKRYANGMGVRIIGDIPIFLAYHSADVWAHQELFELDEIGRPLRVAGVPPDYFSETGQLWGNPLYRWEVHAQTGYAWWLGRVQHALKQFDLVRIDHFRGFANYWAIPAAALTAKEGEWQPGPGDALFEVFKQAIGNLPIIAEDLGLITPDVIELRDKFELPGMRILQFAFGEDERNYFLPHHYVANSVAYTGTHDNNTCIGWWRTAKEHEKEFAKRYLGCDGGEINWTMMYVLSASAANTVIFPMQDVLGLDGRHRMNYPGTAEGNWEWRFSWEQLAEWQTARLAAMTVEHKRNPGTRN